MKSAAFQAMKSRVFSRTFLSLLLVFGLATGGVGCAAGVIGAIIGLGGGGGGGGGGGTVVTGTVTDLQVRSEFLSDVTCEGCDPSIVEQAIGIKGVVNRVVNFSFQADVSPLNGSLPLDVSVLSGGAEVASFEVADATDGRVDRSIVLPSGIPTGEFQLRVTPATEGDGDRDQFEVVSRLSDLSGEFENYQFRKEGVAGTAAFSYKVRREGGEPFVVDEFQTELYLCDRNTGEVQQAEGLETVQTADGVDLVWDSFRDKNFGNASGDLVPFLALREPDDPKIVSVLQLGDDCESFALDNTPPRIRAAPLIRSVPVVPDNLQALTGTVILEYRVEDDGGEDFDLDLTVSIGRSGEELSTLATDPAKRLTEVEDDGDGVRKLPLDPERSYRFVWDAAFDLDRLRREARRDGRNFRTLQQVDFTIAARGSESSLPTEAADVRRDSRILDGARTITVAGLTTNVDNPSDLTRPLAGAAFGRISSIATDSRREKIYFADAAANVIWRTDFSQSASTLERIVGSGVRRSSDASAAPNISRFAELNAPFDLAVDDSFEGRTILYVIERSGVFARAEVNGNYTPLLDGEVLNAPRALTIERSDNGNFAYIADTQNCRIIAYRLPEPDEDVDVNDTDRASVISGTVTQLEPERNPRINDFPSENGCNIDRDRERNCDPGFCAASTGLGFVKIGSRRFLITCEPIQHQISLLDLGREGDDPLDLSPKSPQFLFGFEGSRCFAVPSDCVTTLLAQPRSLRVFGRDEIDLPSGVQYALYFVSDSLKAETRSRGFVVRADIIASNGVPAIRNIQPVAGINDPEILQQLDPDAEELIDFCTCAVSSGPTSTRECGGAINDIPLANPLAPTLGPDGRLYFADQFNSRIRGVLGTETMCPETNPDELVLTTLLGDSVVGRSSPESRRGLAGILGTDSADGCLSPRLESSAERALSSKFSRPFGLVFVDDTTLLITERSNNRVRFLDLKTRRITTIAGQEIEDDNCSPGRGDGGPATAALLSNTQAVAVFPRFRPSLDTESTFWCDDDRQIFIADTSNHRVRVIEDNGRIRNYAGSSLPKVRGPISNCVVSPTDDPVDTDNSTLGNNPAPVDEVYIKFPRALAVDSRGRLLIADCRHRILMVDRNGSMIRRVIGKGIDLLPNDAPRVFLNECDENPEANDGENRGDGPNALQAILSDPKEMVFDAEEEWLFFVDSENDRIRRARYNGDLEFDNPRLFSDVQTIVGSNNERREFVPGETIPALEVVIRTPIGLDMDYSTGELYFTTRGDDVLFRVASNLRTVQVVAGVREAGSGGDGGIAADTQFNSPAAVRVDGAGNVYIAENISHRIRRVTPED